MDGYELPAAQVFMVGDDGTNKKLAVKGDGSFEQEVAPWRQLYLPCNLQWTLKS